jgi:phospholipid/cholesterol/gamma-HCH transport system substrate-binding protein
MSSRPGEHRIHPRWWTVILIVAVAAMIGLSLAIFNRSFASYVPVTLTSARAGLVMETGGKVKLRGVEVGRVAAIRSAVDSVSLTLELFPDQIKYIPANVEAEIKATTAFGAKYVDLIEPERPEAKRISAGSVVHSRNVTTEVNTLFESLVSVVRQVDPQKLNGTLTALAEGLGGQGDRIGQAITDSNQVLLALNPRMDALRADWRSTARFSDAYSAAAPDIVSTLRSVTTSSRTIVDHRADLDTLLLAGIGFADSGTDLLSTVKDDWIHAINVLEPTTDLLEKYSPSYTCMLVGAEWLLTKGGGYAGTGGNGRTTILDATPMLAKDPYRYPDDLPIVAAKGGPGGKPGCGSLPIVDNNWPVRDLVTNSGFGTGMDIRPNPGIAHPWWVDYLPTTRAVPEPPSVRGAGPPAIGPVPYPGAPPYGAPMYGPDGTPSWPGVPPLSQSPEPIAPPATTEAQP